MYLEEPAGKACAEPEPAILPLPRVGKAAFIPALVCAGVSVLLMRAGFFTFFFLVPLGFCAVVFGPVAAWLGAVFAVLGNGVWSAGFSMRYGGLMNVGMDMLYFTVLVVGFTWIMAGNTIFPSMPRVRTVFRFAVASAAGALVFFIVIFSLGNNEGAFTAFRSQIEAVVSSYIAASGADAAQQAFLEQTLTADRIIDVFLMIILRGGALFSAFVLFFFNRQMAFVLARLRRRKNNSLQGRRQGISGDLVGFYVPRKAIWVLTLCLPVILLCRTASLELVEITAWNFLVMCAIMFFAQGGGIILFYLARRPMSTIMRLLCGVLIVCVIFSPGINVLAVGMLVLLGIAENWLSLRVKKQEAPGV
jgi:hypothetical protein